MDGKVTTRRWDSRRSRHGWQDDFEVVRALSENAAFRDYGVLVPAAGTGSNHDLV